MLAGGTSGGFRQQVCRLPSPPFSSVQQVDGALERKAVIEGFSMTLASGRDGGWLVACSRDGRTVRAGWDPRCAEFFLTSSGGDQRIPAAEDPFAGISWGTDGLSLLLSEQVAGVLREGRDGRISPWKGSPLSVSSPGEYRNQVIMPLLDEVYPRLHRIFRYSRPLGAYPSPGSGDVVFTLDPGSMVTPAILLDIDGYGPSFLGASPGSGGTKTGSGITGDPSLQQMILPFPLLDASEGWYAMAVSDDAQGQIHEIRKYAAAALFASTQPRDPGFEAKARAILADHRQSAEPVRRETLLRRGDILVREQPPGADVPLSRSVFIIRFIQEGGSRVLAGSNPVARGFWLGAQHPVGTEDLPGIPGTFRRVIVRGDDRYDRILRHLLAVCQGSGHPFRYQRTGPLHDPVITLDWRGLSLQYRPMERRFGLSTGPAGSDAHFALAEEGYPVEAATACAEGRDAFRWQGLPLVDARYDRDEEVLLIILEDAFLAATGEAGLIPVEGAAVPGMIGCRFIPGSEYNR